MTTPLNLRDYEAMARERLPAMVYDYYAGGANDEVTVVENSRAWDRYRLRPRTLVDVSRIAISTSVLGQPLAMPVLTAPCGFNALAHPEGECAVAVATAAAGIIQILSTPSTRSFEEIAAASPGPRWFQPYCFRDRGITRDLVARAEAAGCSAHCLTVDVPLLGRREREIRGGFHLPPGVTMKNLEPYALDRLAVAGGGSALARYVGELYDRGLTWDVVDWFRSITRLPLVAKGILTAEDARRALDCGVDAIVVSNHGGRQLDGALSTCEALPGVVDAVAGRVEVLVDGGLRRGTDVLKALALGARAVLIGRPYLWALAVDGEAGVRRMLGLLREEIELAMALAGRPSLNDLDRTLLAQAPPPPDPRPA